MSVVEQNEERQIFEQERKQMVKHQLLARDITDGAVLDAMGRVPRHQFVPAEHQHRSYGDYPLPIGHGQTISQPYIVAFMSQELKLKKGAKVLEIGTGSGYQTAVLVEMGYQVYSIEIVAPLGRSAADALQKLGYGATLKIGDGYHGMPEHAPFDGILVTAAPTRIPTPLVEQLADGGRMVIPVGRFGAQTLHVYVKAKKRLVSKRDLPVMFVPMTGEARDNSTD